MDDYFEEMGIEKDETNQLPWAIGQYGRRAC